MDTLNIIQPCSNTQGTSFSPAEIISSMTATYCCRYDSDFSLESQGTDLSLLIGYSNEEIAHTFQNHFLELMPETERQEFRQKVAHQLAAGDEVELACQLSHKDGRLIWVLNKCRKIVDASGNEYLCGILTDITKSKSIHDDLRKKLDQLNIILAQTENIIFEWDLVSDSIFFSDTWERIFGYAPITKDFGKIVSVSSHLHPDDIAPLFEHLRLLKSGTNYQAIDARIARADGKYLWCRFRATAITDQSGQVCKLVGIIINVDADKRATSELKKQAERDSLTRLLNKHTARLKAKEYLNQLPGRTNCALLIIDLDNFKFINDQHGHMVGDSVLTQCAKKIKNHFRPHDLVARIGGDEFMVLMKDIADRDLVRERCTQLIAAFRKILQPYAQALALSCSIGVSFAPDHGVTYYDLFVAADQALYQAKGLGKNQYTFYDAQLSHSSPQFRFPSAINDQIDSNEYHTSNQAEE